MFGDMPSGPRQSNCPSGINVHVLIATGLQGPGVCCDRSTGAVIDAMTRCAAFPGSASVTGDTAESRSTDRPATIEAGCGRRLLTSSARPTDQQRRRRVLLNDVVDLPARCGAIRVGRLAWTSRHKAGQ
jgi:hypothetical protein